MHACIWVALNFFPHDVILGQTQSNVIARIDGEKCEFWMLVWDISQVWVSVKIIDIYFYDYLPIPVVSIL